MKCAENGKTRTMDFQDHRMRPWGSWCTDGNFHVTTICIFDGDNSLSDAFCVTAMCLGLTLH